MESENMTVMKTESGLEVFANDIDIAINDACAELEIVDLLKEGQRRWKAVLEIVGNRLFKNTNVLKDTNKFNNGSFIRTNCNRYNYELVNAVEATAGTKPTAFTWLQRCRQIGGINLSQEQIDMSCIEDAITKYAKGRQDTGGEWELTFLTGAVEYITTMMTAAETGKSAGKATWFVVWIPEMDDSFYVIAEPGTKIPLPEIGDNSALEIPLSLTIAEYKGLDTAIEPTAGE